MTEKVIFEFRASNDKDGTKYEIRQGEEKYTYPGHISPCCFPFKFTPRLKKFPALHRRYIHRYQKHLHKRLNALENMYADFYGNQNAAQENDL
jgi:hypothetical protein